MKRWEAWQYALPPDALRRGTTQRDLSRLQRAVWRAVGGEPLRISVAGGSVSSGMGAPRGGRNFVNRLFEFVNATFTPSGGRSHALQNGAVQAANSAMYEACTPELLSLDADIYVVEFSVNDANPYVVCKQAPTGGAAMLLAADTPFVRA